MENFRNLLDNRGPMVGAPMNHRHSDMAAASGRQLHPEQLILLVGRLLHADVSAASPNLLPACVLVRSFPCGTMESEGKHE